MSFMAALSAVVRASDGRLRAARQLAEPQHALGDRGWGVVALLWKRATRQLLPWHWNGHFQHLRWERYTQCRYGRALTSLWYSKSFPTGPGLSSRHDLTSWEENVYQFQLMLLLLYLLQFSPLRQIKGSQLNCGVISVWWMEPFWASRLLGWCSH